MNANHETTTKILGELTSAVETVEAKQQALDDAIESRNTIIMEALREGVPADAIAERMVCSWQMLSYCCPRTFS